MAAERKLLAARMAQIEPFHVMALLARARAMEAQGRAVIHLEIGEPDFQTPEPVMQAARAALDAGHTHYTPALGLPALREEIARYYLTRYGVQVSPRRIMVTTGASGALLLALGVLVDPGDQVLMADPGYPCNRHFVRFVEGEALAVPVGPQTAYQLSTALLEQYWTPGTVAALIATPSNPTGTLVDANELQGMAEVVRNRGGHLLVDEIYHGLIYGAEAPTALSLSDDVFVINSFSKYFCMTGWRLGWLVVPEAYVDAVDRLAQNLFLAPPTLAQHAALAAFSPETLHILEQRRDEYRRRRDFLLPALRDLGFDVPCTPQGAFYIYAGCERFTDDSFAFAEELLEQAGIAVTPGLDFGGNEPGRHLRFSYSTSIDNLKRAVDILRAYLQKR